MIRSYRGKATQAFARGERVKAFDSFRRQAERALDRLDVATSLQDVMQFPGHRLEKLKGDRAGQFSVRINNQWRICFNWPDGSPGPEQVEIVDYH
jgi:toxin HigB-1